MTRAVREPGALVPALPKGAGQAELWGQLLPALASVLIPPAPNLLVQTEPQVLIIAEPCLQRRSLSLPLQIFSFLGNADMKGNSILAHPREGCTFTS
jgi:hypothetical protein